MSSTSTVTSPSWGGECWERRWPRPAYSKPASSQRLSILASCIFGTPFADRVLSWSKPWWCFWSSLFATSTQIYLSSTGRSTKGRPLRNSKRTWTISKRWGSDMRLTCRLSAAISPRRAFKRPSRTLNTPTWASYLAHCSSRDPISSLTIPWFYRSTGLGWTTPLKMHRLLMRKNLQMR